MVTGKTSQFSCAANFLRGRKCVCCGSFKVCKTARGYVKCAHCGKANSLTRLRCEIAILSGFYQLQQAYRLAQDLSWTSRWSPGSTSIRTEPSEWSPSSHRNNPVWGSIKFKSPTGIDSRRGFGGSIAFPPPSHSHVSASLGPLGWNCLSNVTVGFGHTSPFGLNTRYPVGGAFKTTVTSAALPLIDIKPILAYKLNDQLAIGVSADIYTFASFFGQGHVEQKQVGVGASSGASVELNGKGTGAGATVSLLYAPLRNSDDKPIASIGLVYRSHAVGSWWSLKWCREARTWVPAEG